MTQHVLDSFGRPVSSADLTREIMKPTRMGARTPISSYPADGLDPVRLAQILRAADHGDPVRFLELAEQIEERDLHYLGVLGTRKRSVSQLDITVKPASDDAADVDRAQMVEDWIARDELTDELFDILDAIGKGYSFTEIIWDQSEGQRRPGRLEWVDPRHFRFSRLDLKTPMRLEEDGREVPLEPFKFVFASIKAKSGLALRSGLSRIAAWAYMFKKYTERDWAIFTQTYGQPVRLGKYQSGASAEDRNTLFQAVANIAGDCAAIIPSGMEMDFIEAKNVGSAHALYKERADWLDQQISKATLGQTTSTDAISGGHAVSQEHREVQGDIERADAKALAGILNVQLVRPWMGLEFGALPSGTPRIMIGRPEKEDLTMLSNAIAPMIDRGMKVGSRGLRAKFGLEDPAADDEILVPAGAKAAVLPPEDEGAGAEPAKSSVKYPLNTLGLMSAEFSGDGAQGRSKPSGAKKPAPGADAQIANLTEAQASEAMQSLLGQFEAMFEAASSLDELRETLAAAYPEIDVSELAAVMGQGFAMAMAAGAVTGAEDGQSDG